MASEIASEFAFRRAKGMVGRSFSIDDITQEYSGERDLLDLFWRSDGISVGDSEQEIKSLPLRRRGQELIRWPERYKPEATAVHAHTELEMPLPPEAVWPWLVRAELWPTWYPDFQNVAIEGGGPDLKPGASFRWKAFGVTLDSKVEEFLEFERIAWSARSVGIDAYHAWLIERRPSGCRVLTEENQNGWAARLNNTLRPRFMARMQQSLLERLLEKAKGGPP